MAENLIESRMPVILAFDVLLQYLMTLGVSEGFNADEIKKEVLSTFCFREMTDEEWSWSLSFLVSGGEALQVYDEYHKLHLVGDRYYCTSKQQAMRHRLHIGTIVSDAMLKVRYMTGGYVGVIEEYFISRLSPAIVSA